MVESVLSSFFWRVVLTDNLHYEVSLEEKLYHVRHRICFFDEEEANRPLWALAVTCSCLWPNNAASKIPCILLLNVPNQMHARPLADRRLRDKEILLIADFFSLSDVLSNRLVIHPSV